MGSFFIPYAAWLPAGQPMVPDPTMTIAFDDA
jgi:hypothetical protein